jgi:hypothetical protein
MIDSAGRSVSVGDEVMLTYYDEASGTDVRDSGEVLFVQGDRIEVEVGNGEWFVVETTISGSQAQVLH